jgi:NAD(P)-dependent dehydrogenase (short-subunit alcohol dehydrogenase family)
VVSLGDPAPAALTNKRQTASGIGLATVKALSQRSGWELHVLDFNPKAATAIECIPNTFFHQVNITNYAALGIVFRDVFRKHRQIDFVYANAGISEKYNEFYALGAKVTSDEPPPAPSTLGRVIDVMMTAAATTAFLAQHYFRLSPPVPHGTRSLVFTASAVALYPSAPMPIYAAAKHAVLGLMRSIAPKMYRYDGVRVNAVLPGSVLTNLLEDWSQFPKEYATPVESIVKAVLIFVDGKDAAKPEIAVMQGQAIECSGKNQFYRDQYEYCDETMQIIMDGADNDA